MFRRGENQLIFRLLNEGSAKNPAGLLSNLVLAYSGDANTKPYEETIKTDSTWLFYDNRLPEIINLQPLHNVLTWRYANGIEIGSDVPEDIIQRNRNNIKQIKKVDNETLDINIEYSKDNNNYFYFSNNSIDYYFNIDSNNIIKDNKYVYILSYTISELDKVRYIRLSTHKSDNKIYISNIKVFPVDQIGKEVFDITKKLTEANTSASSFYKKNIHSNAINNDSSKYFESDGSGNKNDWWILDLKDEYEIDKIIYYNNINTSGTENITMTLLNRDNIILNSYVLNNDKITLP
jgi:hypothetical protein